MRTVPKLRPILALNACLGLAACASAPHVTAFQEAPIPTAPRTLSLALDQGEKLPFGIAPDMVAAAAARAGFVLSGETPRYRLALSGALGASKVGSYLPAGDGTARPNWVARPDHNWRAIFAGGRMLRITAVLIDGIGNREIWRGTGTLRTSDPGQAPELARDVLAKLPHS